MKSFHVEVRFQYLIDTAQFIDTTTVSSPIYAFKSEDQVLIPTTNVERIDQRTDPKEAV